MEYSRVIQWIIPVHIEYSRVIRPWSQLEPYTSTATEILPKDRVTRGQIAQSSDIKEAQTNKEPAIPEAPIIKKVKKRVFGAMRPEEAKRIEEDGKKIRRVWDPDLGV